MNKEIINRYLQKQNNRLTRFFGIKLNIPRIKYICSRKEINNYWKKNTPSWMTAWVKNGTIYILEPEVYCIESNHAIGHFWQTLIHELSHLYYIKLTGMNYPKWINEGLACYLANQNKTIPTQKQALKIFNYFKDFDKDIYDIGFFWINALISCYGKDKLINLIKKFKINMNESDFNNIFFLNYQLNYNKKAMTMIYKKYVKNTH